MNELPSVRLTRRFLALCLEYGSMRLGVRVVAVGWSTGVAGLPESDRWVDWDADEMQAAVDYLERKCGRPPNTALVDEAEPRFGDGLSTTRSPVWSRLCGACRSATLSPDGPSLDAG